MEAVINKLTDCSMYTVGRCHIKRENQFLVFYTQHNRVNVQCNAYILQFLMMVMKKLYEELSVV